MEKFSWYLCFRENSDLQNMSRKFQGILDIPKNPCGKKVSESGIIGIMCCGCDLTKHGH